MSDSQEPKAGEGSPDTHSANPGYVLGQLSRAFTTSQTHGDPATRERATQKIARWAQVFQGMLSGVLAIGSRTPVSGTPAWATLEVMGGGFASGNLLAGGPIQPHEVKLLGTLPTVAPGAERGAINSYYLSEAGFANLREMLESGAYRLQVPEEGMLLVVAWMVAHGHVEEAQALLSKLGPFIGQLRFYPAPAASPFALGEEVYRQNVSETIAELRAIRVRPALAREREALLVWAPLYDEAVALFAETVEGEMPSITRGTDGAPLRNAKGHFQVEGGWPCQHYPSGWRERAQALLDQYAQQRAKHQTSAKPERADENFARLRGYLAHCIADPAQLTGREVGLIRAILAAFAHKRGLPGSPRLQELRTAQVQRASRPTNTDLAQVLIARLAGLPQDEGIDALDPLLTPVTAEEAGRHAVPAGLVLSPRLVRSVERALAAPVEILVERGILPSGEALARVIPQLSAQVRVAGIPDPVLHRLYGALYTAFRRRRSLLLFNLQHQVKFEELPWVKAIDAYRTSDDSVRAEARQMLTRVVTLTISAFPQQILPNKLLREIRALAESAGLTIPIVDEVAADIFMGTFSEKYLRAAQRAAGMLQGSLYERYYGLPYAKVLQIDDVRPSRYGRTPTSPAFDRLCHDLAGAAELDGRRSVARNGMIIEQEQILTTHNLAVLFAALDLGEILGPQLDELASRCFRWICAGLQRSGGWKSRLRTVKNCAYAWRQMVFFLALLPAERVADWLQEAEEYVSTQPPAFQARFRPALAGLALAAAGETTNGVASAGDTSTARRFLGWTTERHWLLP